MKQKQFYFIYVFLLSMSFLGACSKDSPNELIPNTIVKIEIDELPGKRIYFIGEELDVSDMTLKVFYSNETSEIVPVKKDEVTGFNSTVPENDQILEVHKGSFTVTFKIQVLINDIQAISIKTLPSKTVYTLGEPLSLSHAFRVTASLAQGSPWMVHTIQKPSSVRKVARRSRDGRREGCDEKKSFSQRNCQHLSLSQLR